MSPNPLHSLGEHRIGPNRGPPLTNECFHCSNKEKFYAHHITQAAWAGARIIQGQWTPYAERLFDLLILTFSHGGKIADLESLKRKSALSDQAWDDLLQYTIQVSVECFVHLSSFHSIILARS